MNTTIAGEMRIIFLVINVNPARNAATNAKPIDVLEFVK